MVLPSLYDEWAISQGLMDPPASDPNEFAPLAPPEYNPAELVQREPYNLLDRLGMAGARVRPIAPNPYAGGGTNFATGLFGGLASGFGAVRTAELAQKEQARTTENVARKDQADRNYDVARDTWKLKLGNQFKLEADKAGNVTLTKPMADAAGLDASRIGQPIKRDQFDTLVAQKARDTATQGDRDATRNQSERHFQITEGRLSRTAVREKAEKVPEIYGPSEQRLLDPLKSEVTYWERKSVPGSGLLAPSKEVLADASTRHGRALVKFQNAAQSVFLNKVNRMPKDPQARADYVAQLASFAVAQGIDGLPAVEAAFSQMESGGK
jgi:hypothetical protein